MTAQQVIGLVLYKRHELAKAGKRQPVGILVSCDTEARLIASTDFLHVRPPHSCVRDEPPTLMGIPFRADDKLHNNEILYEYERGSEKQCLN